MKVDITIPSIGESVSTVVVSALLKANGAFVKEGEEILEVETDKVNQVLYATASGQLTWNVKVEEKKAVGDVIGFIDTEVVASKEKKVLPVESPLKPPAVEKVQASSHVERRRMSSLRKTIAEKLVQVKNQTAMLTTFNEVDMSEVIKVRTQEKDNFEKKYGVRLGFMSFFVKASYLALKAYPIVGSFIENEEIVTYDTYDIGVAVSTEKGLFVPVLRGCEGLSFAGIEKKLLELATKSRDGKISLSELQGGIFTITNGGVFGSLLSTPILNSPQSAILGMHTITKRPMAINDEVVIRPMMYLALSYDHRIIDGKQAVEFLVHIKKTLENPMFFNS